MAIHAVNKIIGQYEVSKGFKKEDLRPLANDPITSSIQFSSPLDEQEIGLLDDVIFSQRPDIALRVYGHYLEECNLSFLRQMPSLRKVSADCLRNAKEIEVVTELKNLETLGVGIFELDNFDFLYEINPNLKQLYLHQTRSKKPKIDAIARFVNLEELYLEAQSKGIDAVNSLKKLKEITLRSISTPNLNFLSGLKELWSVDVKLGGIKDFNALKSLPNLKYLELWQVRELSDITFISDLTALQHLFIQSLPNIKELPDFNKLNKLKRLELENLKGLNKVDSLRTASSLTEFIYTMAQNQEPENLLPVLENKSVRSVFCMFGSDKKNNRFKELADNFGKSQYEYSKFLYQ
ncbi:hypothetical protein [Pedobacter sp. SYP-B3415]|uniref:hypothetical protein n=1 Tax=Pedobacter sp. SYP-B3415 TaxID=2496641 RepID=UPI00101E0F1D|nr:hypothetical protein [Pedobacter sp. SYP-B3415]